MAKATKAGAKDTGVAKPRIILWDIETSNLVANFGYTLCAGWKVLGEKQVHVIKISDFPLFKKEPTNDLEVVRTLREALTNADGWVTWYGSRFDEPYVNSRLLNHGLAPLPPMSGTHVDGWRIARFKMKLNSNRLASVSSFLGVEEKTALDGPTWIKAMAGHKPSLEYVYDHCRQDVVVLEQVYEKIKVLHTGHFNINLTIPNLTEGDNCPRCGAKGKLQRRGFGFAHTSKHQRYQCQACGAWSRGKPERVSVVEVR